VILRGKKPFDRSLRGWRTMEMGPAERAIKARLAEGQTLHTPVRGSSFAIGALRDEGLIILIGAKQSRTLIRWPVLEDLILWLESQGWVEMGGGYTLSGREGTVDGFLKARIKRDVAGWVVALLETAGVIDIDRQRPARVRAKGLAAGSSATASVPPS
jgi:hypothetical protein